MASNTKKVGYKM